MSDLILYYFFSGSGLIVLVAIPLYFIIIPIKWGIGKIEDTFNE